MTASNYQKRRRRHAGFTLTELVMTLVIAGLLAAVVGPRFFSSRDFQERGFYDETVAAVRYAQKLAFATGCGVQVNISNTGYSLVRQNANCLTNPLTTWQSAAFTQPVSNPTGSNGAAFANAPPSDVTLNSTTAQFYFCPQGQVAATAENCGNGTVLGANVTVTVNTRQFQVIAGGGYVQTP